MRILPIALLLLIAAQAETPNSSKVYSTAKRPRALALIGDRYHSPVYIRDHLAPALLKEKHLRVKLRQGDRHLPATAWNFAERLAECECGPAVDVAFGLEEDNYGRDRGWSPWRAVLKDVRYCHAVVTQTA